MAWSRYGITDGIDFPQKFTKAALKSFRQYLLYAANLNPVWTGCGYLQGVRMSQEVMAYRTARLSRGHDAISNLRAGYGRCLQKSRRRDIRKP